MNEKTEEILQNIENINELEKLEIIKKKLDEKTQIALNKKEEEEKKKRVEEYSNKLKKLEDGLKKSLERLQSMTSEERTLYYDEKVKKINEALAKERENIKKLQKCNYIHNPNIMYKSSSETIKTIKKELNDMSVYNSAIGEELEKTEQEVDDINMEINSKKLMKLKPKNIINITYDEDEDLKDMLLGSIELKSRQY